MDLRPDLGVRRALHDPRTRLSPAVRKVENPYKSGNNSPVSSAMSCDRIGMLLMEANEISQYLKKDYVCVTFRDEYFV